MNNIESSAKPATVLFLISVSGEPIVLVPAISVEDARTRAIAILRTSPEDVAKVARNGVSVVLFTPAVQSDGHTIGYTPAAFGNFENDGSNAWATWSRATGSVN